MSFHQTELQQGWDASFGIAPKQTKVQGNEENKTEKPNKSSYISHGGSVESKSKSHNFSMVCLGPNLHSHDFLSAKTLWQTLQFIKHMNSFSLATIRSHSHWEQDTFQTKVFSVTVHWKILHWRSVVYLSLYCALHITCNIAFQNISILPLNSLLD